MNKSDSRRIGESFASLGYGFADSPEEASVVVFNTCSVREHAEEKAMSHIGRLKFLKKKNPNLKICVAGCMAQRMGSEIKKRLNHVDIIAGPASMAKLPKLLNDQESSGVYSDNTEVKVYNEYLPDIIINKREYARFVPLMRGCDNFCAYCIVPYVRGREKYRKKEDVLKECRLLVEGGIKEITLLGQAVNSHPDFKEIIKSVSEIKNLKRLRFLTSYPGYMDKETVDIVKKSSILCNMFHFPLQSGSDRILKKMKRKYSVNEYFELADYIREQIPSASISTDIIVGFPGEDEKDFIQTLKAVERVEFDQSYTFKYSSRQGTEAAGFRETVSGQEKQARLIRLNRLCDRVSLKRNRLFEGVETNIFSDGGNSGRTEENKIVHFSGDPAPAGEKVLVLVTEARPHSLKGKRVE